MAAESMIKLTRGVPPAESFPADKLAVCAAEVLAQHGDIILQYGPSRGFPGLLALIAQETGVAESQVIIGQGSLQLQDLCARMFVEAGDVVYTEDPSYDRTLTVLRRAGARVVGIPLDDDGPNIEMLQNRLQAGERPVLFYIIPDFQNPSGTLLSLEKRQRIAALAQQYGFWVIEDVPYRKLRYAGVDLPTLFELAPDRVIQMSSFSKLISPGLRVGFAVGPEPVIGQLAKMAEDTYINPSYLNQAMVAEFAHRGWLDAQIEVLKQLYTPRLQAMLAALETYLSGRADWRTPQGGFFVGMTLRAEVSADDLLRRAREANLLLTDGRGFFTDGGGDCFVRLPFCALTPAEIDVAIARLAQVVDGLA
ncbi:MAG: PLP-dependent aminotransferase family protein [Anaerolineae bacterium]|nr:PLP-dependent aminotransferase family protein [Anaerolineae bacterium]